MRFKVDENVPREAVDLLRAAGHDAVSVLDQGLQGSADSQLANISRAESRALVTLDLDFSDIRTYPPARHSGLVVLRLRDTSKPRLLELVRRILPLLDSTPIAGTLWIVEEDRVRVRE